MRVKEEFTEAQRRFGLLSFYDKFEHIVILILPVLIRHLVLTLWVAPMPSVFGAFCSRSAFSSIQSEKRNCGEHRPPRRKPKTGQTVSFSVTLLGSKRQSETRASRVGSFNGGRSFLSFQFGAQNDRIISAFRSAASRERPSST